MSSFQQLVSLLLNFVALALFLRFTIKHSSEIRKVYNNLAPYAIPLCFFAGFRDIQSSVAKTFSSAAAALSQSNDFVLYRKAIILFLTCLILCWPVFRRLQQQFRPSVLDTVNTETNVQQVMESPVAQPIPPPATSTEEIVKKMHPAVVAPPTTASELNTSRRRKYPPLQPVRDHRSWLESDDEEWKDEVEKPLRRSGYTKLRRRALYQDIEASKAAQRQKLELEQRSAPTDQLNAETESSEVEAVVVPETSLDATFTVEELHSQETITKVDLPSNTVSEESVAAIQPAEPQEATTTAAMVEFEAGSDDMGAIADAAPVATVEDTPAASSSTQMESLYSQEDDVSQEAEEQGMNSDSIIEHLVETASAPAPAEIETPAPESATTSSPGSAKSNKSVRWADEVIEDSGVEATIEQQPPSPSPQANHGEVVVQHQPSIEPVDELPTFDATPANAVVTEFAANTIVEQQSQLPAFNNGRVSIPADHPQNQAAQELAFNTSNSGEQFAMAPRQSQPEFEQQLSPVRPQSLTAPADIMDVEHYTPSMDARQEPDAMDVDDDHVDQVNYNVQQYQPAEPTPSPSFGSFAGYDDREDSMQGVEQEDSTDAMDVDLADEFSIAAAIAAEFGDDETVMDIHNEAMETAYAAGQAMMAAPVPPIAPAVPVMPAAPIVRDVPVAVRVMPVQPPAPVEPASPPTISAAPWRGPLPEVTPELLAMMEEAAKVPIADELLDEDPDFNAVPEPIVVDEFDGTDLGRSINGPYEGGPQTIAKDMEKWRLAPYHQQIIDKRTGRLLSRVCSAKRKLPIGFEAEINQYTTKRSATLKGVATNFSLEPGTQKKKITEPRLTLAPEGENELDYPDDRRRVLLLSGLSSNDAQSIIVRWLKLNLEAVRAVHAQWVEWTGEIDQLDGSFMQMVLRLEHIKDIIFMDKQPRWMGSVSFARWRAELIAKVDVVYEENHLRQFIDEVTPFAGHLPTAKMAKQTAEKLVRPLLPSTFQPAQSAKAVLRDNAARPI